MIGQLKGRSLVGAILAWSLCFGPMFALPAAAGQIAAGRDAGVVVLDGLRSRVVVRRDERGIPYIEADNEGDLYFAQGYATASDRLWQMDLLRRTARGELSEILGPITLDEDKRRRVYGFAAIAEALVNRLAAPVRAQFEAYSRGVNAYIDSCEGGTLPPEFGFLQYRPTHWRPSDCVVIGKLMAETLSTSWHWDIMRAARTDLTPAMREALSVNVSPWDVPVAPNDSLDKRSASSSARAHNHSLAPSISPEIQEQVSTISSTVQRTLARAGLYAPDLAASNNWVVSGKRTASGRPLLANDPHLSASAPSIWYMTHLSMPRFKVAGVTFPGVPGIIVGHNQDIAWGMTNLGADVQDLYLEKFDQKNKGRYQSGGDWRQAEVRKETINVRKSLLNTVIESVAVDVLVTSHGPIILESNSTRYALKWVALDAKASELTAFYWINRARNWKEFGDALRDYTGPPQNFVYADVKGHIGYYGAGRVPIRRKGNGSLPYDGSGTDGDWIGYIPFDRLPHVYDPTDGIIVTANNRIVGPDYPYHLTNDWSPPYRARRILDLLLPKQKLSPADLSAIQGDIYSISGADSARRFVETVRRNRSAGGDRAGLQETVEILSNWDGRVSPDSRAAVILPEIRHALRRRVLVAALGPARAEQAGDIGNTFVDVLMTRQPREWLPKEFADYSELLRACERDAREVLAKRLGPDPSKWTWERQAVVRFSHPLGVTILTGQKYIIAPFPQNGSGGTLTTVNVGAGVSMRLIADCADWDNTRQGIALGESGDPSSPHWQDQLNDWRRVTTRAFPFTTEAVRRATQVTVQFSPKQR